MYKFCALSEEHEFPTFKEAYTAMHKWVKERVNKREMSFQVLETMIWIECPPSEGIEIESHSLPLSGNTVTCVHPPVLYFYDARDRAYAEGILVGLGKLVE